MLKIPSKIEQMVRKGTMTPTLTNLAVDQLCWEGFIGDAVDVMDVGMEGGAVDNVRNIVDSGKGDGTKVLVGDGTLVDVVAWVDVR